MALFNNSIRMSALLLFCTILSTGSAFSIPIGCICNPVPILTLNGLSVSAESSGGITAESELDAEGNAPILSWSVSVGGSDVLEMTIDATDPENKISAEPPSGIDADITVNLAAHVLFNGDRYDSPTSLQLSGHVQQWPPTESTVYTLQNTVTFQGPCGTFELAAGSQVTVSPQ